MSKALLASFFLLYLLQQTVRLTDVHPLCSRLSTLYCSPECSRPWDVLGLLHGFRNGGAYFHSLGSGHRFEECHAHTCVHDCNHQTGYKLQHSKP